AGTDGQGGWYGEFQFHRVYQTINEFCIVELSAFYLDVLKDRMYTFAPQSAERRSAQTVLWKIAETLVRLVAPILTFTADEVWEYLPAVEAREASVHLALFPKPEEVFAEEPGPVLEEWKWLLDLRDDVLRQLESARQDKLIGKALEADIYFLADGEVYELLKPQEATLREILNVSFVSVSKPTPAGFGAIFSEREVGLQMKTSKCGPDLSFAVLRSNRHKCARCWNFMPEV